MNFLNIGYYIVERMPTPEYLDLKCKQIITISNCICNTHPSLAGSFYINCEKQHLEYKKSLGLSGEDFEKLKETVLRLYDECKLDVDSRFLELSDALLFCENYLHNKSNSTMISIALEDVFFDLFAEDTSENLNTPILLDSQKNDGDFIGYDILGWDWSSFHSYLCNNLNQDILNKYPLEVNEYGLIQNPYSQVKEFTKYIDGKGEPVIWLPYVVYKHVIK